MERFKQQARQRRRGNAVFMGVSVIVLMGFTALVVDVGHARMTQAQLLLAAEAGAHAGVSLLDGTDDGVIAAEDFARDVAGMHWANNQAVVPQAVISGIYNWNDGTFTPDDEAADINAIEVITANDVSTLFGFAAFGRERMTASARSIAVMPAPTPAGAVDCYLPFGIPDCFWQKLQNPDSEEDEELDIRHHVFRTSGGSEFGNTAWTMVGDSNPSNSAFENQLDACFGDNSEELDGAANNELASLNPGQWENMWDKLEGILTSEDRDNWFDDETRQGRWAEQLATLAAQDADCGDDDDDEDRVLACGQLEDSALASWQGSGANATVTGNPHWGNILEGPVIVYDGYQTGACDADGNPTGAGSNNENGVVVKGFAWGVIFDIGKGFASGNRNMQMFIDPNHPEIEGTAGGGTIDAGIDYYPPPQFVY